MKGQNLRLTNLLRSRMALILNTELFAASVSFRSSLPLFNSPAAVVKLSTNRISYTTTTVFSSLKEGADHHHTNGRNEEEKSNSELPESNNRKLSSQSSWEAKDEEGNDYLYMLGKESDNMNIAVGARAGIIDDLFTGNFLGKDCNFSDYPQIFFLFYFIFNVFHPKTLGHFDLISADIVFDYRQKATRSFEYLQGDYYIAPHFMVH